MTRPSPPSPSPLLPTFPDTHPLAPSTPTSPPLSQPVARRLSHAVGAYVFHLDSPPHLCACRSRSLWSQSTMSSCLFTWSAVFFSLWSKSQNHIPWKLTNSIATSHCQNLQVFPCVTAFVQLLRFESDPVEVDGGIGKSVILHSCHRHVCSVLFCLLRSCEPLCYFSFGCQWWS